MIKPAVIESMNEFEIGIDRKILIRVWREEVEVQDEYHNPDLLVAAAQVFMSETKWSSRGTSLSVPIAAIAMRLLQMERVNAVQVGEFSSGRILASGRGVVLYKEWP